MVPTIHNPTARCTRCGVKNRFFFDWADRACCGSCGGRLCSAAGLIVLICPACGKPTDRAARPASIEEPYCAWCNESLRRCLKCGWRRDGSADVQLVNDRPGPEIIGSLCFDCFGGWQLVKVEDLSSGRLAIGENVWMPVTSIATAPEIVSRKESNDGWPEWVEELLRRRSPGARSDVSPRS